MAGSQPRKMIPKGKDRTRALVLSYLPDWLITVALFIVFALIDKAGGFKREFSLTDTSIQHTHTLKQRIPFWAAVLIAGGFPVLSIIAIGAYRRSTYDIHNGLLGIILALAITTTLTDVVKITVGRPRPDFIDRCQPAPGSANGIPYGLVTVAICTQTDMDILNDGFKSFFSGHTSFSFCGLGYLSFFLAGKLHMYDQEGHAAKAWISLTPLIVALLVGISRAMDYRHHWHDILVGGIVGMAVAHFSYRQYYPPLNHPECHKPYAPRIPLTDAASEHELLSSGAGSGSRRSDDFAAGHQAGFKPPTDGEQEIPLARPGGTGQGPLLPTTRR